MAFEGLTEKLNGIFAKLKSRGKLSESDIKAAMREVKLALLEADVNFKVVKSFIEAVSEKSVGEAVLKSLTPGQQVVKIVHQEMIDLLGKSASKLNLAPNPPTVIMVFGLQGAGKNHVLRESWPSIISNKIQKGDAGRHAIPTARRR